MTIKYGRAVRAAVNLVETPFDPASTAMFFEALSGWWAVRALYARMIAHLPPGEAERLRALTETPLDEDALLRMPAGTLGRRYGEYARARRFHVNGDHPDYPAFNPALDRNWIMRRFARLHDILHLLLDFEMEPAAETGLQLFHLLNFGEPFGALAVAGAPLVVLRHGRPLATLREMQKGFRIARQAKNLFTTPIEDLLAIDLDEARRRLGIVLR